VLEYSELPRHEKGLNYKGSMRLASWNCSLRVACPVAATLCTRKVFNFGQRRVIGCENWCEKGRGRVLYRIGSMLVVRCNTVGTIVGMH